MHVYTETDIHKHICTQTDMNTETYTKRHTVVWEKFDVKKFFIAGVTRLKLNARK